MRKTKLGLPSGQAPASPTAYYPYYGCSTTVPVLPTGFSTRHFHWCAGLHQQLTRPQIRLKRGYVKYNPKWVSGLQHHEGIFKLHSSSSCLGSMEYKSIHYRSNQLWDDWLIVVWVIICWESLRDNAGMQCWYLPLTPFQILEIIQEDSDWQHLTSMHHLWHRYI